VRNNPDEPFGGIQVILFGDFYQLPPVGNKAEPETSRFCFESPVWSYAFPRENIIVLTTIFRQKDETYSTILNQIRQGRLKKSNNDFLLSLVGKEPTDAIDFVPTKLYPTRQMVDSLNKKEMELLTTPEHEFQLVENILVTQPENQAFHRFFSAEDIKREILYIRQNLLCGDTVRLKVGAQVMCVVNIDRTDGEMICNGSQGKVVRFASQTGCPVVRFTDGTEMEMGYHTWKSEQIPGIGVTQIPLILAWAITIHKSQGATLKYADIDVGSGIFECGQTYVAMSRVTGLEGLKLSSFDASKIYVNRKVRDFYDKLAK
jgi:ATP-dependent DNA helicase PIF1